MSNDSEQGNAHSSIPNELQQTLGDRLRKSMEYAGMSIEDSRLYLGIHRNSVSNYINDRNTVPAPVLRLWAIMCKVPLEWLETGVWPEPEAEEPAPKPKKAPRNRRRNPRSTDDDAN